MRMRRIVGWSVTLVALSQVAHADVIVTGGSVAATATAGDTAYVFNSDTPTPLVPQVPGVTSLNASATGEAPTVDSSSPVAVSSSANASVDVENDSSGATTLTLYSKVLAEPAHEGSGFWSYATSTATDTVNFTVGTPTEVEILWSALNDAPDGFLSSSLSALGSGTALFRGGVGSSTGNLLLSPGQYQLYLQSQYADVHYGDSEGQLTLTAAPVPIPTALWLFISGVLGLGALTGAARMRRTPSAPLLQGECAGALSV